jgi:hypothetical protein
MLYFMAISNILLTYGIFYDILIHFVFIGHIFSGFGIMHQEKSGNPGYIIYVGSCGQLLKEARFLLRAYVGTRNFAPRQYWA